MQTGEGVAATLDRVGGADRWRGCYMLGVAAVSTGWAAQQHAAGSAHHRTAGYGGHPLFPHLHRLHSSRPLRKRYQEVSS